jgi:hypothetical protein
VEQVALGGGGEKTAGEKRSVHAAESREKGGVGEGVRKNTAVAEGAARPLACLGGAERSKARLQHIEVRVGESGLAFLERLSCVLMKLLQPPSVARRRDRASLSLSSARTCSHRSSFTHPPSSSPHALCRDPPAACHVPHPDGCTCAGMKGKQITNMVELYSTHIHMKA